jgi:hypothetical protein
VSVTPLLDFFRRGEVAKDVKLLAAAGALAPRAHEQVAILIHLQDDPDPEVRTAALGTIDRIPIAALTAFLGRSDVGVGIREFFADRGVFPAEMPSITLDEEPLIPPADGEADASSTEAKDDGSAAEGRDEDKQSLLEKLAKMSFTERLKAALKGSREMRAVLIRDPNKMVAASVLSSPKMTESEVEAFAKMTNVSDEVLRVIASNRAWTKNYGVVMGLTKNPKTPVALSLTLMGRLNVRDLSILSTDRNVPEALRAAARRRVSQGDKS